MREDLCGKSAARAMRIIKKRAVAGKFPSKRIVRVLAWNFHADCVEAAQF
jgi:hypothetical protein